MILGQDFLGAAHPLFPVDYAIALTPSGSAIGIMDTAFGNALPVASKFIASGKFPIFRFHIWWADDHKIAPLDIIQHKAPLYNALALSNPNVRIYLSHSCEYKSSDVSEVLARINLLKKLAPNCIPVNCPIGGSVVTAGDFIEYHGSHASSHSGSGVSLDGQSAFNVNIENFNASHSSADYCLLWSPRYNIQDARSPQPPRPQRTAAPSPRYIQAMIRLMTPKGTPPGSNIHTIPILKPLLWKFAEDVPNDTRGNKPCLIIPENLPSVSLFTANNKLLGTLINDGGFPPNLHRYYAGKAGAINEYGYEIGAKALDISGSEFIRIKAGAHDYGWLNPGFRTGYFDA